MLPDTAVSQKSEGISQEKNRAVKAAQNAELRQDQDSLGRTGSVNLKVPSDALFFYKQSIL